MPSNPTFLISSQWQYKNYASPSTTFFACTKLLESNIGPDTDEKQFNYLQLIQVNVKRINQLLNNLLLVKKVEAKELNVNPSVLDLTEFCFHSTGKPIQGAYHSFYGHYHLTFDQQEGQHDFRETVNRIFDRNGIAFELNEEGRIERLAPEGIREAIHLAQYRTGDNDPNSLLETARSKYLDPDLATAKTL